MKLTIKKLARNYLFEAETPAKYTVFSLTVEELKDLKEQLSKIKLKWATWTMNYMKNVLRMV